MLTHVVSCLRTCSGVEFTIANEKNTVDPKLSLVFVVSFVPHSVCLGNRKKTRVTTYSAVVFDCDGKDKCVVMVTLRSDDQLR